MEEPNTSNSPTNLSLSQSMHGKRISNVLAVNNKENNVEIAEQSPVKIPKLSYDHQCPLPLNIALSALYLMHHYLYISP